MGKGNCAGFIPARLRSKLLSEQCFSEAYEKVSARQRAWLKSCIAALHLTVRESSGVKTIVRNCIHGFDLIRKDQPYAWAVLAIDADTSPSQALAALLPMIYGRIPEIVVASSPAQTLPPALITAFELAGQENILLLDENSFNSFKGGFPPKCGLWVDLRSGSDSCFAQPEFGQMTLWRPKMKRRLGLWSDKTAWDFAAVMLSAGLWPVEIWGSPGSDLPDGNFIRRQGPFTSFLRQNYGAVYVPQGRVPLAQEVFDLVLQPGCEGCWLWPELRQGIFARVGYSLGSEN